MTKQEALEAILIPPQLDLLCKEFNLRVEELEPNFEGWTKHVIMAPECVFLFPRHSRFNEWLEKELEIYGVLGANPELRMPELLRIVDDATMSYYKFGVVSRLKGIPFWTFDEEIGVPEYEALLRNLGRQIAAWHDVAVGEIPAAVGPLEPDDHENIADQYRWMLQALSAASMDETLDAVAGSIEKLIVEFGEHRFRDLVSDKNRGMWGAVIKELSSLDPVLIHGDVAEAQILVRSKEDLEITGITDWSTAAIASPLFDFNFWEWGFEIWRFRGSFRMLRRAMWEAYVDRRGISLTTLEGLHLFYVLQEVYWLVKERKPLVEEDRALAKEVRCVLEELEEVNRAIWSLC